MPDDSTRDDLLGDDRALVALTVRRIVDRARQPGSAEERASVLGQAVTVLDGAVGLDGRERDARTRALLSEFRGDTQALSHIARSASHVNPAVRNAVRAMLPPELRGEYGSTSSGQAASSPPRRDAPPPAPPPTSAAPEPVADETTSRVVLLLGSEAEHAGNRALLAKEGFGVILRGRRDDLDVMATNICGLVVGSTFWSSVPEGEHRDALVTICELSSIVFLHIDTHRLAPSAAAEVGAIVETAHAAEPSGLRFRAVAGCTLVAGDLAELRSAGSLIESATCVRLHPAGIDEAEETLLRAAVLRRIRSATGHAPRLERIQVRFLDGGRSSARLAVLQPNDGGPPFVAKLDTAARLRDELRCFRDFISRWDGRTQPVLHFHGGRSAILFSLVDDPSDGSRPAPMLESRMSELITEDLAGRESSLAEALTIGLGRAVDRLARLNGNRCATQATSKLRWMAGEAPLAALTARGIQWELADREGRAVNLADLARRAATCVERLDGLATAHGDVHLRNILLKDDRDPYFIDFAWSGGFHPCYDLVRLDVALSPYLIPLQAERQLTELFHSLLVEGASLETLSRTYPVFTRPQVNRLVLSTAIATRRACLGVLERYGGRPRDYLAMQIVIASWALRCAHMQGNGVRARLGALATAFGADAS